MDLKHRIGDFGALVLGPGAGFTTRAGVVLTTASGTTLAVYWIMDALRGAVIQVTGGLIHQYTTRGTDQRPGNRDALPLTAG